MIMILRKKENFTKMRNPTQQKTVFALVLFAGVIVTILIQI